VQFLGGSCFVRIGRGYFWYSLVRRGGGTIFELSGDQVFAEIMEAVETGKVAVCCRVFARPPEGMMCGKKV
jgi:hypothetical protein